MPRRTGTREPSTTALARALAALSWLGLFVLGLEPICAQEGKAATGKPIDAAAIRAVLARLDDAFRRGDVAAYLAEFVPDHPGAHAMLGHNLERAAAMAHRECTSTLVGEPRCIGPRTVVRVQQAIHLAANDHQATKGETAASAEYLEHLMLAVTRNDAGKVVPTFAVEFPVTAKRVSDQFRCPACNYEIGGAPGWLCVPLRSDRAGALEAVSFYLVGTDIACDVTVQVDADAPTAMELIDHLGAALGGLEPSARAGTAAAWLPPAHRDAPPPRLNGARLEIDLPASPPDGDRAVFHVLAFGGLQHLLLLRGGKRQLTQHQADVDRFLASYRMLEQDCDLALAAARPLAHHTGGHLDGNHYDNTLHGVTMQGPAGWKATLHCGGAAFRVVWQSESGAKLWLTGLTVPPGMVGWCRITADRWLRQLCLQKGLEPPPTAATGTASGWIESPGCEEQKRTVAVKPMADTSNRTGNQGSAQPGPGTRPSTAEIAEQPMRWIHLQVQPDLLLVADGYASTTSDELLLRRAFESLRRK